MQPPSFEGVAAAETPDPLLALKAKTPDPTKIAEQESLQQVLNNNLSAAAPPPSPVAIPPGRYVKNGAGKFHIIEAGKCLCGHTFGEKARLTGQDLMPPDAQICGSCQKALPLPPDVQAMADKIADAYGWRVGDRYTEKKWEAIAAAYARELKEKWGFTVVEVQKWANHWVNTWWAQQGKSPFKKDHLFSGDTSIHRANMKLNEKRPIGRLGTPPTTPLERITKLSILQIRYLALANPLNNRPNDLPLAPDLLRFDNRTIADDAALKARFPRWNRLFPEQTGEMPPSEVYGHLKCWYDFYSNQGYDLSELEAYFQENKDLAQAAA